MLGDVWTIEHSRRHLSHRASSLYFFASFRLATLALSLGVSSWVLATLRGQFIRFIGLLGLRGLFIQFVATGAGPASHRVSLWQGGPASILASSSGTSCTTEAPLVPSGVEGIRPNGG